MAIIVPAILEKTKEEFLTRAQDYERLSGIQRMQVDFCDGKFVPNTTVSIADIDSLNPAYLWEAHLMVEEPVDFFDYQMSGFGVIIVHYEGFKNPDQLTESLTRIRGYGLKVGLAVNPETDIHKVIPYASLVDQYTLLSIHPGMQGQDFLPESYERIKDLKSRLPDMVVEVDGGIHKDNIRAVADSGADLLIAGSALHDDPAN
jgi:ribulose-phosphate 3-epimerase